MDERDIEILRALADNKMNASEAGRKIFMHRNTMAYHLGKIKRKTGLDPYDFYDLNELLRRSSRGWFATDEYMTDECPKCGARINIEEFDECSYHPTEGRVMLNYCPNCGSRNK